MKIGDKVKLNERFFEEGREFFGKHFKTAQSESEIVKIENGGEGMPRIITLANKKQFAEIFLTLTN